MTSRGRRRTFALMTALLAATIGSAAAFDDDKYPNLEGQWTRAPIAGVRGQPSFDPSKAPGHAQQAPLTPEYQAIFEANVIDQANGGFRTTTGWRCGAWGLPAMMNVYQPMEIIVLPETTYILTSDTHLSQRRIFTDGREWPDQIEPAYQGGLSLGRWIDEDGDGRYDVLEIETRSFKGPRVFGSDGIPLHADNKTIVKERLYLDKANPNILHNQITVIDNALTRPWTADKRYQRDPNRYPVWGEYLCADGQTHVRIGTENYYKSAEGLLMPSKKDQAPPDLRYFETQK